jgi:hypothetical protein
VEVAKKATDKFTWMRCRAAPRPTVVDWQRIQILCVVLAALGCLVAVVQIGLWHNNFQRFQWWSLKASLLLSSPTAAYQEESHEKIE